MALLFTVIHAHAPAENQALVERVAEALCTGGRIAVLDLWAGSRLLPVWRAGLRFVALTYLSTLGADVYEYEAVASWLRSAGFTEIEKTDVGPVAGMGLVEARLE